MSDACTLNFKVSPTEFPASNIHAIIGRNGVGKSYLLTEMVESAIQNDGRFSFNTEFDDNFSRILSLLILVALRTKSFLKRIMKLVRGICTITYQTEQLQKSLKIISYTKKKMVK